MSLAEHKRADHQRILIVDDEPQITRVLRTSLDAHAYDVRVANDGDTALQIAHDWPPDLMITDLSMPVMDGLELCRRFRQKSNAPIIVLSVKGEERTKVQALDVGADDYVTKPFGINELLARVRANIRRAPQGREPRGNCRGWRLSDRPRRAHGGCPWSRAKVDTQRVRSARIPRPEPSKGGHSPQIVGRSVGCY